MVFIMGIVVYYFPIFYAINIHQLVTVMVV